jgi:hypothetical protein
MKQGFLARKLLHSLVGLSPLWLAAYPWFFMLIHTFHPGASVLHSRTMFFDCNTKIGGSICIFWRHAKKQHCC